MAKPIKQIVLSPEQTAEMLERIRSTLKNLVLQCEAGPAAVCCPIIESLAHSASIE